MSETVYLIDPAPIELRRVADALAGESVTIETYDSAEHFLGRVVAMPSGCVLVPADLPGMGARALIEEIQRRDFALAVVVIGREPDLAVAVELVRAGAVDFLEHPFSDRRLRSAVRRAIGANA
jgi:FixJ family two-component response regulator